jgi:acetyl/propionyl-CoA carboxylase alpha subunit
MGVIVRMNDGGEDMVCDVLRDGPGEALVRVDDEIVTLTLREANDQVLIVEGDDGQHVIHWMTKRDGYELLDGAVGVVAEVQDERDTWLGVGGVGGGAGTIKSQMPGKVVSIKVEVGQSVQKGDTLLSIEAMKMENEVVSPGDGVVRSVNVEAGSSVEAGEALLVLGEVGDE